MAGAILVTLFCCVPFGIVAIVYAAQVNGARDVHAAKIASSKAADWINYALYAGLTWPVFWLLFVFLPSLAL